MGIAVAIGTPIMAVLGLMFRYAFLGFLGKALLFVAMNIAGLYLVSHFIPDWLTLTKFKEALEFNSPAISYALQTIAFWDGLGYMMNALICAWIFKKLPSWMWLGSMYKRSAVPVAAP